MQPQKRYTSAMRLSSFMLPSPKWLLAKAIVIALILLTLIPKPVKAQLDDTAVTLDEGNVFTQAMEWGDWDNDRDLDLMVAHRTYSAEYERRSMLRFYENVQGTVSPIYSLEIEEDVTSAAWGDMDNDGQLELVLGTCESSGSENQPDALGSILILENNLGATDELQMFQRYSNPSSVDTCIQAIALADWDDNDVLDIGVMGVNEHMETLDIYILENDMPEDGYNYRFAPSKQLGWHEEDTFRWLHGYSRGGLTWADYNGDNFIDLAVARCNTLIFENNSGIEMRLDYELDGCHSAIGWGYLDSDTTPELAVLNDFSESEFDTPFLEVYKIEFDGPRLVQAVGHGHYNVGGDLDWADYDNDDDYDIAVASYWYWGDGDHDEDQGNNAIVYINTRETLTTTWESTDLGVNTHVAWADVNNDGLVDLSLGVDNVPLYNAGLNRIYYNHGTQLTYKKTSLPPAAEFAWGDWNNDGVVELAAVHDCTVVIYEATGSTFHEVWNSSTSIFCATSVAWGDWDNDQDLDLAVGNGLVAPYFENGSVDIKCEPNQVFENIGGGFDLVWQSENDLKCTSDVEWGDWDNDGDLDLGVANTSNLVAESYYVYPTGGHNQIYENIIMDSGTKGLILDPLRDFGWEFSDVMSFTSSLAWGDWDNDGDLDIAFGNGSAPGYKDPEPNRVYENINGHQMIPRWESNESWYTSDIAWNDWNQDGLLDLAIANSGPFKTDELYGFFAGGEPSFILTNTEGQFEKTWSTTADQLAYSVEWLDWNNDGWHDLILAGEINRTYSVAIFENSNGQTFEEKYAFDIDEYVWADSGLGAAVASADIDYDGDTDAIVSSFDQESYRNQTTILENYLPSPLPSHARIGQQLISPGAFHNTPGLPEAQIHDDEYVTNEYVVTGNENVAPRMLQAQFALNGSGGWAPVVAHGEAQISQLIGENDGEWTFDWNLLESGVFGFTNSARLRMDVDWSVGPFRYPARTLYTTPFRVRGTQPRVTENGQGEPDALVYRQQESSNSSAVIGDAGKNFTTDLQGYLQGYGQINQGDNLAAIVRQQQQFFEGTAKLYHTSPIEMSTGDFSHVVTNFGVQDLPISTERPLILFDLVVALEWDSEDRGASVADRINRASEILYDWTNGQVALGQIKLYNDAVNAPTVDGFQPWLDAHIRVYASNRMRPSASQGGVVPEVFSEQISFSRPDGTPRSKTIDYYPGHVRIGVNWNRYGDTSDAAPDDWSRALAHELGHFLLFLDDNYLGYILEEDGSKEFAILESESSSPAQSCAGAMNDPYVEAHSEFHPQVGWDDSGCRYALSNWSTGRSDWETITTFYPMLYAPTQSFDAIEAGPKNLVLDVTQVVLEPDSASNPQSLESPTINIIDSEGGGFYQDAAAEAYLLRQENYIVHLGRPINGTVEAYGAESGDRLCVFAPATSKLGCETLQNSTGRLQLIRSEGWQPQIRVSPITSTTIDVHVQLPTSSLSMQNGIRAKIYSANGHTSAEQTLNLASGDAESRTFSARFSLADPILEGYVHVWHPDLISSAQSIVEFSIGGNPAHMRSRGAHMRSRGAHMRSRGAPVISSDGQVIVFGDSLEAAADQDTWHITLQAVDLLPSIPPGRNLVGQGYVLSASAGAPGLDNSSEDIETWIGFSYLQSEVDPVEEPYAEIYKYEDQPSRCPQGHTPCWLQLPTHLNTDYNFATTPTSGPGLYALLSTIQRDLDSVGWNQFRYPGESPTEVEHALESIDGEYRIVHRFEPGNVDDQWLTYAPGLPEWVTDLSSLVPDKQYWIYISKPATIYFDRTPDSVTAAAVLAESGAPSVFFGALSSENRFTPTADMEVQAFIGQNLCGISKTFQHESQVVFVIDVHASDQTDYPGCGTLGSNVSIIVNGREVSTAENWDNTIVQRVQGTLQPPTPTPVALPNDLSENIFLPSIVNARLGGNQPPILATPTPLPGPTSAPTTTATATPPVASQPTPTSTATSTSTTSPSTATPTRVLVDSPTPAHTPTPTSTSESIPTETALPTATYTFTPTPTTIPTVPPTITPTPIPASDWTDIGEARNITAMTAYSGQLYATTTMDKLWRRQANDQILPWSEVGAANKVVGLTNSGDMLYAATSDDKLWRRTANGSAQSWDYVGAANKVTDLASDSGYLYAATTADKLWRRIAGDEDSPWDYVGIANNVVAMTSYNGSLYAVTSNGKVWQRLATGDDLAWTHIDTINDTVGLAASSGYLYVATSSNRLLRKQIP